MLANIFLPNLCLPLQTIKLRTHTVNEVHAHNYVCMHFPGSSLRFGVRVLGSHIRTSSEYNGCGGQVYVHTAQATAFLKDSEGWKWPETSRIPHRRDSITFRNCPFICDLETILCKFVAGYELHDQMVFQFHWEHSTVTHQG